MLAMSLATQREEIRNGGKVTRRQWLALSLVRHGERIAPWTHATFNDLQALGLVSSNARRAADDRLLTTKAWRITEAGIAAYARGSRA